MSSTDNKGRLSNWLSIDGRTYDVIVTSLTESGTILYSDKTGRTINIGADMVLDPLGTFYNYTITVKRNGDNYQEYNDLYNHILTPTRNGFKIHVVHDNSAWDFQAYISTAERELQRIDAKKGVVYWKEMQLEITAMRAQVIPT